MDKSTNGTKRSNKWVAGLCVVLSIVMIMPNAVSAEENWGDYQENTPSMLEETLPEDVSISTVEAESGDSDLEMVELNEEEVLIPQIDDEIETVNVEDDNTKDVQNNTFTLVISESEGGRLYFHEEKNSAEEDISTENSDMDTRQFEGGEIIIFACVPDDGYFLQEVYAKSLTEMGKVYPVEKTEDGYYRIEMPEDNIEIQAVFIPDDIDETIETQETIKGDDGTAETSSITKSEETNNGSENNVSSEANDSEIGNSEGIKETQEKKEKENPEATEESNGTKTDEADESEAEEILLQAGDRTYTCGNVKAVLSSDGTMTLTGTGDGKMVSDGSVSSVPWRDVKSDIKKVVVGAGVSFISYAAFRDCTNLKEVDFSKSDKLSGMSNEVFANTGLSSVSLPPSLRKMASHAFANCSNLTEVKLNEGLEEMANHMFQYTPIKSITLPSTMRNIFRSFDGMDALETISVAKGNPVFQVVDGVLIKNGNTIVYFPLAKNASSYTVPSNITKIEEGAFYAQKYLKSIVIPKSVKEIGDDAFSFSKIASVSLANGLTKIGRNAFFYCTSLSAIQLPDTLTEIGQGAFVGTGLKEITIPASVKTIGAYCFDENVKINYAKDSEYELLPDGSAFEAERFVIEGTANYNEAFEILNLVNQERKKNGLSALTMDKELLEAAMLRAAEIVAYYDHTRPGGMDCDSVSELVRGENIAIGTGGASNAMYLWMNSAPHRANILGGGYKSIGVGSFSFGNGKYWVQLFGNKVAVSASQEADKPAQVEIACRKGDVSYKSVPETISAVVGENQEISIYAAKTGQEYLYFVPSYLTWKSDDNSIASVNSAGLVTCNRVGKTLIHVISASGKSIATIPVTVAAANGKVSYQTHVQTYGWQDYVSNGAMSGTTGQSKRLEGIRIKLENQPYSGNIEYRTHVQTYGWQGWKKNGEMAGTSGEAKRLEAIQIRLTGEMAKNYDIYYQTHIQNYGWSGWATNGEMCGSQGYAYRLEGIRIQLVKKGGVAPGSTANPFYAKPGTSSPVSKTSGALIGYNTHVQTYGWQNFVYDGGMSGTQGESKRLEGIQINLVDKSYSGDIVYRTHVQTYGWQNWKKNGEMSGTSGESKRLEGIQIYLTGDMAKHYDVYYRVHAQTYGWLDWAKNGVMAGTSGLSKRLEGINIKIVPKGGSAPGATAKPYVVGGGGKLPDNPYHE